MCHYISLGLKVSHFYFRKICNLLSKVHPESFIVKIVIANDVSILGLFTFFFKSTFKLLKFCVETAIPFLFCKLNNSSEYSEYSSG